MVRSRRMEPSLPESAVRCGGFNLGPWAADSGLRFLLGSVCLAASFWLVPGGCGAQSQPGRERAARVERAAAEEPGGPVEPVIPAGPRGEALRWNVRPYAGVSMVGPGGLDAFPETYVRHQTEHVWSDPARPPYGARVGSSDRRQIDWAVVEGVTVAYQASPLIEMAVRLSSLRTQHGRFNTAIEGAGGEMLDAWTYGGEMLTAQGGGGFRLTLTRRTRLLVSLLLGFGLADVAITHNRAWNQPGGSSLADAHADVRGTAFVPEFCLDLEHDVVPALSVAVGLGYRFADVDSFKYRRPANLYFLTSSFASAGDQVRDPDGILGADFGGPVLTLNLTARI